jgi:hypothetical protein
MNIYKIIGNTPKSKLSCGHTRNANQEYYIERTSNGLFTKCEKCVQGKIEDAKVYRIPNDLVDSDYGKVLPIR